MQRPVTEFEASLPGYTALRETPNSIVLDRSVHIMAKEHDRDFSYRLYLNNPVYDRYLRMHKVLVGESGAKQLLAMADDMAKEQLPKYLDAAGSAYMEAGIALQSQTAASRIELANLAEDCWQRSLLVSQAVAENDATEIIYEDSDQFRTALNLAYAPVLKSLILGNVTDETRRRVMADTLAIAQTSSVQLELAKYYQDNDAVADHVGFLHECNTLLTLLNFDDPKYVPAPSFNRADNGIYHRNQSHDIIIFNQHWGNIKKIIPIEVKSKLSKNDRERYDALLVRGKMHLIVDHGFDPVGTLRSFTNLHEGTATNFDVKVVNHASNNMLELLRLYQRGQSRSEIKTSSRTKFHDSQYVSSMYSGSV